MVKVADRRIGQIYSAPDVKDSLYVCKTTSVPDPELKGFGDFYVLSGSKSVYVSMEQWYFLKPAILPKGGIIGLRKIIRRAWKVKWDRSQ
jgi:hypothetical protein